MPARAPRPPPAARAPSPRPPPPRRCKLAGARGNRRARGSQPRARPCKASSGDDEPPSRSIAARFTDPVVEDPGLPLADALVAGAVAPTLLSQLVLTFGLPRPMWLFALNAVPQWRGLPYVLPTLAHGAALASCWLVGALSAELYASRNYGRDGEDVAVAAAKRAGAAAAGVLLFATQTKVFVLTLGYDPTVETDAPSATAEIVRILPEPTRPALRALVRSVLPPPPPVLVVDTDAAEFGNDPYAAAALGEVALDVGFEALVMLSWRRLRAQLYAEMGD